MRHTNNVRELLKKRVMVEGRMRKEEVRMEYRRKYGGRKKCSFTKFFIIIFKILIQFTCKNHEIIKLHRILYLSSAMHRTKMMDPIYNSGKPYSLSV